MCGICGFYGLEDKQLLLNMCSAISHRGRDDRGIFISNNIGLGNQRLSIIDLKHGKQPIYNENQSICVVCNGEIYNYKELKKILEKNGHRFYTNSDTEVIVHAYEEYGIDCFKRFNGMFAFALSDGNKLIIARDRLGVKPLYYYSNKNVFLFGSEIKALLKYEVKKKVCHNSLFDYLTFRYTFDETLFEGIHKLKPGHYLIIDKNGINEVKYWDIKFEQNYYLRPEGKLFLLLKNSVKERMMSDVPLGAFISGGIDSAAVLGLMSKESDKAIKTFTIGFDEDPTNAIKDARIVAEHFNAEHHEKVVDNSLLEILPKVIYHLDEPIVEPSILPGFKLAEFAKKYVTVALTGEGADEILYGYPHYKIFKLTNHIHSFTLGLLKIKPTAYLLNLIPKNVFNKFFHYPYSIGDEGKLRLNSFVSSLGNNAKAYYEFISLFSPNDKILNSTQYNNQFHRISNTFCYSSILHDVSNFELKNWLPNQVLLRLDKTTMAHALEARVPFLDYKLVEYAATLPNHLKLNILNEKFILKKAMKGVVPQRIIKKKKSPFFTPIAEWFEKDIKQIANSLIEKDIIKQYFNIPQIQKIIDNHNKSMLIYSRQLWAILSFYVWYEIFLNDEKIGKLSEIL